MLPTCLNKKESRSPAGANPGAEVDQKADTNRPQLAVATDITLTKLRGHGPLLQNLFINVTVFE